MLLFRSFNFQFNFTEGCYLCKTAIQIHMTNTINKAFHDFQILDVIKIWHRDRKRIIIGTMIGMIASIVVALVLPTYYESKTILYPISMTMADRNIIFGQQQGQAEFSYFGNKYDASRILQVANSSQVIDYIINKYHLADHYNYAKDETYLNTKVHQEFLDNYNALKNDKDAIEITLLDTDKDLCAKMVNDIAAKIDEIATLPVIEGKAKIIKMLEIELEKKNKQAVEIKNAGDANKLANVQSEIKQLSEANMQYNVSANDQFSSVTILEKAQPAEKKSKPIRWVIVISATLITLVFCLLMSIFIDQWSYLKSRL